MNIINKIHSKDMNNIDWFIFSDYLVTPFSIMDYIIINNKK